LFKTDLIRIRLETKQKLYDLKLVEQQSYNDVIVMLIKEHSFNLSNGTNLVLSNNLPIKKFILDMNGKIHITE
jgi:predicted CopG family antitoxin